MSIETALFGYLSTYAGLTALVGTRVYPLNLPPKPTLPAVTYQKVSGARIRTMGNTNLGGRPRFQLTAWADTYAGAKDVAAQLQAALEGYNGVMGGVTVRMAEQGNELDDRDPETGRYLTILDFTIIYEGA
jgi:hypothetical protein